MKKLSLLIFAASTIILSCEKKQTTAVAETQSQDSAVVSDGTKTTEIQEIKVTDPQQAGNVAVTTNAAASPGKKPALNPAHGEPYHRCEIAVGAPIDSAPTQQNAAPMVSQQAPAKSFNTNPIATPAVSPSVTSAPATGPKPATNPAHGEPHHRCDLTVGAPLI